MHKTKLGVPDSWMESQIYNKFYIDQLSTHYWHN